jgi:polyhydroxybutyrate depolymerase
VVADGVRRTFLLSAPGGVGRHPLVVLFHGFDETAAWIDRYTQLPRAGIAAGFIVAAPQGIDDRWNFARRPAIGPDDVAFVRALVTHVKRHTCLDGRRVFVTGFSDGADMADTVACDLAGIGAVAGVAASVPVQGCRKPLDVLQIHGDADPIVPYAGGGGDRPQPFQGLVAVSVPGQMQEWQSLDGCSGPQARRTLAQAGIVILRSGGCRSDRRVLLIRVAGGGHTWPGALLNLPSGATNHTWDATNSILHFFEQVLYQPPARTGHA